MSATPTGKNTRNRKILIYAGLAGAGLLLILMMRKNSSSQTSTTTGEGVLQAPTNTGEGVGGGIESGLSQFQGQLEASLPGLIAKRRAGRP